VSDAASDAAITLIHAGANVRLEDVHGHDAYYYARMNKLRKVVSLLRSMRRHRHHRRD